MSVHAAHEARTTLEQRWLTLTRETLPSLAKIHGWPIRNDHCFQRVLLDAACGGRWYDHIDGRPAYRRASAEVLTRAIAFADSIIADPLALPPLNRQSLDFRGKC